MIVAGRARRRALGADPGVLRAFLSTNEIITSLMLNYVAALILNYLIFDSQSYWRDTSSPSASVFPQGKTLPDAATWPIVDIGAARRSRSGSSSAIVLAAVRLACSTRARASASRCR